MALTTLKPRLVTLKTSSIQVLDTKAGATPRWRGSKLQKMRREVLLAGMFTCVDCGRVSEGNEIDHQVPLEQGGTYDRANLRIRCKECHQAKTAAEATARARGY